MKLQTKFLSLIVICAAATVVWATNIQQQKTTIVEKVATTLPAHACHCVPTEHWFAKACVKNYNKQFADAGLSENYDTEGLSSNVLQAIEMLAQDMLFIQNDGTPIVPELNSKGKLILPMSKNLDFTLCKNILHNADVTTTLTAEQLYQQWINALQVMKTA